MNNPIYNIHKSSLFIRQAQASILYYKQNAGIEISEKFIMSLESALGFIAVNPYACAVYKVGKKFKYTESYQFRKWNIIGFPYSIFFHISVDNIIIVDAIYAHKMNISSRLTNNAQKPK
ncbi:MAG: hypothetical protein ABL867_03220 [Rickettsiales bacterium]